MTTFRDLGDCRVDLLVAATSTPAPSCSADFSRSVPMNASHRRPDR
jgi:hypothetical protein